MDPSSTEACIRDNWLSVQSQVADAANQVKQSVTILGVTKYVDAESTRFLYQAGCHDLGENRPQVLWAKAAELEDCDDLRWHMIGHVQTNKLRRTLRLNPLIHSVDSERLLRAIDAEAAHQGLRARVLLEVNISGDAEKTGLPADALADLLKLTELEHVEIQGLMAMSGFGSSPAEAEQQFRQVAALRDDLEAQSGRHLPELSMGMSGDYKAAIAAGATMVRIGSALFAGAM